MDRSQSYIIELGSEENDWMEMPYGYIRKQERLVHCWECSHCKKYYHGPERGFSRACALLYLTDPLTRNDYCSRGELREDLK